MAKSINRVTLVGRVGRDPEIKYTSGGTANARFSVATTDKWGENEHTEWHNIVAWDKLAEIVAVIVRKGDLIHIDGSIRSREYEKDGEKRRIYDIRMDDFVVMSSKSSKVEVATNDDIPF